MPIYVPTAAMEPCTLPEAPRGSVFLPFGAGPLLVGEVDQHAIALRLGGEACFSTIPFSRDERSNVRGLLIGAAMFDADADSAYRVRDANYAPGDLILGKDNTSVIGAHEDGIAFEVAVIGDPQRGLEAGFPVWRLCVAGRDGRPVTVYERVSAGMRTAANSNG